MKKRLFALLLVLCLLACCAVPAFGADSGNVARMHLCYRWSGPPSLGHVWVYIENLTNHPLQVGAYSVPAGQGVSVGNFGLTRADGNGTYYNVECYCANHYSISGMVSNRTDLTQSELNSVNNAILQQNLWLPLVSNCTDFACRVWNAGGGATVVSLGLPVFTKWQIQAHGDRGFVQMTNVSADQVKKQHGTGSGATLSTCSSGTISKQIG